ncbi:hypothetical protein CF319_g2012 [Tilletia indica]|nr:hypothetical protein CF319_g2012 [Tilletia indica]
MSASPEAPPLLPPEVPPQAPPSTPKEKPQPAEKFLFSVGVKPNPKSPSPNKRKKAVSGKAVAVSPADFDSLNREATYERLRSLDKEALIEIIRQKDDMIAALLSVKSASDVERREDTKLVRASLDVVSSAVRSLKTTIEGRLSPAPSSSLAPSSVNSFPPLGTSSSFASTGSSAPLSPSRSLAQVAASAAALPLRPRSTRRNPADALRSAAHSLRSSAPAVSAARAQLQPDQFAIIAVEGFRRMEHSATKQHLSDMGVDVRHVHNVSNVGPILELVVTQSQRDNIVKAITQVPEGFRPDQCLHVKEDFDPSKPFHQDANAEVKERVLADFNSRMRRLQARASTFGWSGLGDFFAGRIDVPAARAARKIRKTGSTPDSGLAPADATMTDAPGPAVSAETAPEASGSSLATSPPALATSAAEAVAPTASLGN